MITSTAIGRLVKAPTLEHSPKGTPVCKFRIACDKARGADGANYLDIVVWGGAEDNYKHLTKGRQVAVAGNLNHQQWTDKDDGYHERCELIAESVAWLAKPTGNPANNGQGEPVAAGEGF